MRGDVIALRQRLRARSDVVTYRTASEIEAVLQQFGPDARYRLVPEGDANATQPSSFVVTPSAPPMVESVAGPQQATHVQPKPHQPVLGQPPHSAGVPPQQLAGQHQWAGGQAPVQHGVAQGALAVWGIIFGDPRPPHPIHQHGRDRLRGLREVAKAAEG